MNENKKTIKIDCLGDICPLPIMKLQAKLNKLENDIEIMLITDHSCTLSAVTDFCKLNKFKQNAVEVINGVWEITISR